MGGRPSGRNDQRVVVWVIVAVALVAILVRTHHVSTYTALIFAALIPSVILHEVSHGALAYAFGDDTAKRAGRLTLNPIPHIDPFGTIILPAIMALTGVGLFGWARPVPVTVSRLRHPRNEAVLVSLVGPAVNIALAVVFALAFRYGVPATEKLAAAPGGLFDPNALPAGAEFLFVAGYINVILAAFNLIPLPPLDGSSVIERLLPSSVLPGYYRIRPFTMFLPLLLVALDPSLLDHVFQPALNWWGRLVL